MNACRKAKTVKKFILTSSTAAVDMKTTTTMLSGEIGNFFLILCEEENYNDYCLHYPEELPYHYAKLMQERECIKFIEGLPAHERFGLIR